MTGSAASSGPGAVTGVEGARLTEAERESIVVWVQHHRPATGWGASAQAWMDLFAAVERILDARAAASGVVVPVAEVEALADRWASRPGLGPAAVKRRCAADLRSLLARLAGEGR